MIVIFVFLIVRWVEGVKKINLPVNFSEKKIACSTSLFVCAESVILRSRFQRD